MTHLTAVPAASLGLSPFSTLEDRHRAVMSLFPPELPGSERERRAGTGILFRVEVTQSGTSVLVRSQIAPSRTVTGLRTREEDLTFERGIRVRWRLAAAGVMRREGRDIGVNLERSVQRYLTTLGGAIYDVEACAFDRQIVRGEKRTLPIDVADGVGFVSHPERLTELLSHGVGRSKAYGCGLLTVAVLP